MKTDLTITIDVYDVTYQDPRNCCTERSALCSVRNFVSVDTVHCEENAHHSRLLRWRGEWGCGLGQLVGCWKGLPAGDAHKGALPVVGIRVASNTAHTSTLPPPCLRMALRLGGGACARARCRAGGPAHTPPCPPPPLGCWGASWPPWCGLGVPIDALWCGELALFALGAAIELQATKTEKTFPRGQISGIKSLLLLGPRAFVLHKLVVPVAPFSRAIREQGGSRALAIKTQEQDKSAIAPNFECS